MSLGLGDMNRTWLQLVCCTPSNRLSSIYGKYRYGQQKHSYEAKYAFGDQPSFHLIQREGQGWRFLHRYTIVLATNR